MSQFELTTADGRNIRAAQFTTWKESVDVRSYTDGRTVFHVKDVCALIEKEIHNPSKAKHVRSELPIARVDETFCPESTMEAYIASQSIIGPQKINHNGRELVRLDTMRVKEGQWNRLFQGKVYAIITGFGVPKEYSLRSENDPILQGKWKVLLQLLIAESPGNADGISECSRMFQNVPNYFARGYMKICALNSY